MLPAAPISPMPRAQPRHSLMLPGATRTANGHSAPAFKADQAVDITKQVRESGPGGKPEQLASISSCSAAVAARCENRRAPGPGCAQGQQVENDCLRNGRSSGQSTITLLVGIEESAARAMPNSCARWLKRGAS